MPVVIRKIVDELNSFINGEAEIDKNKPVMVELTLLSKSLIFINLSKI